jgi:hypothetical protein
MPQDLPEDFVNQEAIQNLELGKTQDLLSQINEAMAQGNAAKAMELAQKFLEMAKNMNKQLSKAHDSFTETHSAEKIARQIDEKSRELEEIAEKQSKLLDQTQQIASQQMDRHLKQQSDKLQALAQRQEQVIGLTTELARDPAWTPNLAGARSVVEGMLSPMREILTEMNSRRLIRTVELMPSVLLQMKLAHSSVEASSGPAVLAGRTAELLQKQTDIWNDLQNMSSGSAEPTREEKQRSESLKTEQSNVEQQTQKLRKSLQQLSQKTASLGAPLMHSLGQAGAKMRDSAGSLSEGNAPAAQKSQEQAMDQLRAAQAGLEQAQSMMSQMAMEQGGGGGSEGPGSGGGTRVMARPGGSGSGSQTGNSGKVRLPTAEDYRPPKAFREDLLEALKERYPKTYEDVIRKYYKRLAN